MNTSAPESTEKWASPVLGLDARFVVRVDRVFRLRMQPHRTSNEVHAPVQRALAELGPLTVATDGDIADISCVYAVGDPERERAVVFLSSVLPYAAVIAWLGSRPGKFVTKGEPGWAGTVVSCLPERGFFVLDDEARRAKRPVTQWPDGPVFSYFEALLQDEFGPPEDYWLWMFTGSDTKS